MRNLARITLSLAILTMISCSGKGNKLLTANDLQGLDGILGQVMGQFGGQLAGPPAPVTVEVQAMYIDGLPASDVDLVLEDARQRMYEARVGKDGYGSIEDLLLAPGAAPAFVRAAVVEEARLEACPRPHVWLDGDSWRVVVTVGR